MTARENDPWQLSRFVVAQGPLYADVVTELRAGDKQSHWMWFIFPQIAGLGTSDMARRFAIADLAEAQAYLAHPVLGHRLRECAEILLNHRNRSARQIFGDIDAIKLRSSMTLFARAAEEPKLFHRVLQHYYGGVADVATLSKLCT